jgi:hypothetical protein
MAIRPWMRPVSSETSLAHLQQYRLWSQTYNYSTATSRTQRHGCTTYIRAAPSKSLKAHEILNTGGGGTWGLGVCTSYLHKSLWSTAHSEEWYEIMFRLKKADHTEKNYMKHTYLWKHKIRNMDSASIQHHGKRRSESIVRLRSRMYFKNWMGLY